MDQLHMHFTQAIHNTVFQVVLGYVELCAGNADTKFQKMQYKDLCTVRCAPYARRVLPVAICLSITGQPEEIKSSMKINSIFIWDVKHNLKRDYGAYRGLS